MAPSILFHPSNYISLPLLSSFPPPPLNRKKVQPVHGSLARFVTHPSDFCFKLPPSMSLEEGAMCEPVSVGVHACRRAGVAVSDGYMGVCLCGGGYGGPCATSVGSMEPSESFGPVHFLCFCAGKRFMVIAKEDQKGRR